MSDPLGNFRKKYPQYKDISDDVLSKKLAEKYPKEYGDLLKSQPTIAPKIEESLWDKSAKFGQELEDEIFQPVRDKYSKAIDQLGSNPLAGGLNLLNALGGTLAIPFMAVDKLARTNQYTEKVADVIAKPFEIAGQVGTSIMPTKEQLGSVLAGHMIHLNDEALQETSEALDELGGMAAMFAVGGGIGKGVKLGKNKLFPKPKIEPKVEPKIEPVRITQEQAEFGLRDLVEAETQKAFEVTPEGVDVFKGKKIDITTPEKTKFRKPSDVIETIKVGDVGIDKLTNTKPSKILVSNKQAREAISLFDERLREADKTKNESAYNEAFTDRQAFINKLPKAQQIEFVKKDLERFFTLDELNKKEFGNIKLLPERTEISLKDGSTIKMNKDGLVDVISTQGETQRRGKINLSEPTDRTVDQAKIDNTLTSEEQKLLNKPDLSKVEKQAEKPVNPTIERLRKEALDEMNKTTAGINPILIQKSIQLGAEHFKAGIKTFTEWSKQMIADLGEKIKPHLLRIWDGVKKIISGDVRLFESQLNSGLGLRKPSDIIADMRKPGMNTNEGGLSGIFQDVNKKDFETISKEYETTIKNNESFVKRTEDAVNKTFSDAKQGIKNTFEALSTSAEKISPELFQKLRHYEQDLGKRDIISQKVLNTYLDAQHKAKLTLSERAQYEAGLDNPKFFDKAREIAQKKGFSKELEAFLRYKDSLAEMLGVKLIENHFPRMVKDYVGLREELFKRFPEYKTVFEKMIADYESKNGKMTYEKQMDYLNNALRGYNPKISGVTLSDLGNMKKRVIPVLDGELKKYYHNSNVSASRYLTEMDRLISEKKFFGKGGFSLDEGIASLAKKLEDEGKIKGQDASELKNILRARFNERGITNGALRFLRDVGIVTKLHNPLAALTQVKDLSFSFAQSPKNTAKVLMEKAFHKEMGFKLEEIGYDPQHMAHELANVSGRQKFIQGGLKANQFFTLDMIGKEVRINSTLKKFQDWASKDINNPEFQRRLDRYFSGEEKSRVISDLKSKNKSDSVGFLLYNELSNMQPITLSELPKNYVAGGNNRIYYFLKTFSVRQLDFVLNETIRVMKNKDLPKAQRIEGGKNLMKLATSLILVGAGVDEVKKQLTDLITGRKSKVDFGDEVINNILNVVLLSRYDFTTFKQEGGESIAKQIAPPLDFPADEVLDTYNLIAGKNKAIKSLKQIPTIGRFLYEYTKKPKRRSY